MTLLIIGGLLAVAILAILGAVFLGVSEQRAEKVRTNGSMPISSSSSIPSVEQPSGKICLLSRRALYVQPGKVNNNMHSMGSSTSFRLSYEHSTSMHGNLNAGSVASQR